MIDYMDSIEVYLYKFNGNDDCLKCVKGTMPDYQNESVFPDKTYFKCKEENKKGYSFMHYYQCSTIEGRVFSGCVWFKEPNERKAAQLLSMYYEKRMDKLQAEMDKIIDKLESLDLILKEDEN
jgi:hypothetical protein